MTPSLLSWTNFQLCFIANGLLWFQLNIHPSRLFGRSCWSHSVNVQTESCQAFDLEPGSYQRYFCVGLSLTWWVCWRPATTRIGSKKNKKVRHNFLAFSSPQLAANFHQKQRREKMMVVVWETRGEACQTLWRLGATQRREAGCLRRELTVCLDWETQLKRQDLKLTAGLALNDLKSIYQLVAKTHKVRPLDENVTGWLWQNPKLYSFVAVSTR